jgi:hypothetical protein
MWCNRFILIVEFYGIGFYVEGWYLEYFEYLCYVYEFNNMGCIGLLDVSLSFILGELIFFSSPFKYFIKFNKFMCICNIVFLGCI